MKTRFLALLLVVILIFSVMSGVAFAENETVTVDTDFELAMTLIGAVSNHEYFAASDDGNITRAKFIRTMAGLLNWNVSGIHTEEFNDLSDDDYVASCVSISYAMGYVSPSDAGFKPNEAIKTVDAVKLAVCAAGYQRLAQEKGGYPLGYLEVASQVGLLKNFKDYSKEYLTYRDSAMLFYNMLTCDVLLQTGVGAHITYESQKGRNLLSEVHNIYELSGIVTATAYSYLTNDSTVLSDDTIEINGESYKTEGNYNGYLGYNVKSFYLNENGDYKIIVMIPYKNSVIELYGEDIMPFAPNDSKITYENDSRRTYTLDSKYNFIYNGRSFPQHGGKYFNSKYAKYTLIDNNNDGYYDVISAIDEKYMTVGKINDLSTEIVDITGKTASIDLSDSDIKLTIVNEYNEEIKWFKLKENTVVAATVSIDGKLVNIREIADELSGTVTMFDDSENIVYIGENKYKLSDYSIENFEPVAVGSSYKFKIDGDLIITLIRTDTAELYGYLIESKETGGLDTRQIVRILTYTGSVEIFSIAKKVILNADSAISANTSSIKAILAVRQLIKYKLNSAGEIFSIDTAEDAGSNPFEGTQTEGNNLRKFNAPTPKYKSSTRNLFPYANIASTTFFVVPYSDSLIENDKKFGIMEYNQLDFKNNALYNDVSNGIVELYDIDINGSCPISVFIHDTKIDGGFDTSETALVEKISDTGGGSKKLYLMMGGHYESYISPSEVSIKKSSNKDIAPGDLIRVVINSKKEIINIIVDYDAETQKAEPGIYVNTLNSAYNISYVLGRIYSSGSGYMYLSPVADYTVTPDYSWDSLKLLRQSTSIVVFDCNTRIARLGSEADFYQYKNGGEGSFIVTRTNEYLDSRFIVLYTW